MSSFLPDHKPTSFFLIVILIISLSLLLYSFSIRQYTTSHAASAASIEAESGVLATGASQTSDSQASGGKYILFAPSSTNSYYVSPSGVDTNSGSITAPFKTVTKALSLVTPGTTIYLRAGEYPPLKITGKSGTSTSPITLKAYPGEEKLAIFTNHNASLQTAIELDNCNYFIIDGIRATQTQKGIIVLRGTGVIIQNNLIDTLQQEGISMKDKSSNGKILNNELHDLGQVNPQFGEAIYIGNGSYPGAYTISFPDTTHDILIKGNHVYNGGKHMAEPVNLKGETYNITVEYNHLHDVQVDTGGAIDLDAFSLDPATGQPYDLTFHRNHIIRFNKIYNITTSTTFSDGNAIRTLGPGSTIYNNIMYGNQHYGFAIKDERNARQLTKIYHNTMGKNRGVNDGGGIYIVTGPSFPTPNLDIRNNIGSSKTGNIPYSDSLFVNPVANDYHLKSTATTAIDKGVNLGIMTDYDGTPRPQGVGYDMGAYEFR